MAKEKTGKDNENKNNCTENNHDQSETEKSQEKNTRSQDFVQPDGGWGWVVCLTSMCANGTVFGSLNTFGILYVAMKEQYGDEDNSFEISLVGSICSGLTFLLSMFSSIFSDRFGIRKVSFIGGGLAFIGMLSSAFVGNVRIYYFTYSVMIGTGFSLVYAPSLVILGHYFKRKMGVANGLVTFGSAGFTIVYSLLMPVLLDKIDLKYTMVCLSGFVFLMMPYSLTWKALVKWEPRACPSVRSGEESVEDTKSGCQQRVSRYLNLSIWRSRGYVVWVIARAIAFFGYFIPFIHLVQHSKDNFPDSDGNLLPMFMSIASGVSRILFGFLTDFQYVSIMQMEQAGLVSLGLATLCIPFANSYNTLVIVCLVMGVCDGVLICLIGPLAFELVGKDGAAQAIGFLFGLVAIPMTLGPPLAGLCYDLLGSYRVAFHIAGAPSILAALLIFLIPKHQDLPSQINELAGVAQSITVSTKEAAEDSAERKASLHATTTTTTPGQLPTGKKCEVFTITQGSPSTNHKDREDHRGKQKPPLCSERVDGALMSNVTTAISL